MGQPRKFSVTDIVLASANPDKIREFSAILPDINFIPPPNGFNPNETGTTFEENSLIKAREAARLTGKPAIADDSGICVEALNGGPGVYSARYAPTVQECNEKLLKELEGQSNRRAKYVCAVTLVDGDGTIIAQTVGECRGQIALAPQGTNGFGYDPIFISDETGMIIAQMSDAEKHKISHRAKALQSLMFVIP